MMETVNARAVQLTTETFDTSIGTRINGYSDDDDNKIVHVMLEAYEHGRRMTDAYRSLANSLKRSEAGISWRWQNVIIKREEVKELVEIAKGLKADQAQEPKSNVVNMTQQTPPPAAPKAEAPVTAPAPYTLELLSQVDMVINSMQALRNGIAEWQNEKRRMQNEMRDLQDISDDYKKMAEVFRMFTMFARGPEAPQLNFKMDANGNLERVNNKH